MKRYFIKWSSLISAAALLFAGCSNDATEDITPAGPTVKVTASAVIPETRVNVGEYSGSEYPVTWTAGDELAVVDLENNYGGNNGAAAPKFTLKSGDGEKQATFEGEIEEVDADYYAIYPYSALFQSNPDYPDFNVTFPETQKPTSNSVVDPAAVILVSNNAEMSGGSLKFSFQHIAAYAKLKLKNLKEGEISNVVFSAPQGTYIAGAYYYYYDGQPSKPLNSHAFNAITIDTENITVTEGACEVIFAMFPVSFGKFDVVVNYSDGSQMTRKCDGKTIKFDAGVVTGFTVDMAKEDEPEVEDPNRIDRLEKVKPGTYYLAGYSESYSYTSNSTPITITYAPYSYHLWTGAVSGTGNSNSDLRTVNYEYNREEATLTLNPELSEPDAAIAVKIELEAADGENTYYIKYNGKYLYSSQESTNRRMALGDSPAEWVFSDHEKGGLSITNNDVILGTAGAASDLLRSYKTPAGSLVYGICLFTEEVTTAGEPVPVPSLSVTPKSLSFSADGESKEVTLEVKNADVEQVQIDISGEGFTQQRSGNTITVTASKNTTDAVRKATMTITLDTLNATVELSQAKPSSGNENYTVDILNYAWTELSGTAYEDKTGLVGSASGALYSVTCGGTYSSIQLRSNDSKSGVVTTTSAGYVRKITVQWNSNTLPGTRQIDIYGSNSAYSSPADLFDTSSAGAKIGSLVCDTDTELDIEDDYQFIGFRSNSGALYLDEVQIAWETSGEPIPSLSVDPKSLNFAAEGGSQEVTLKVNNANVEDVAISIEGDGFSYNRSGSTVTVTASENTTDAERTATMNITLGTLKATVELSQEKPSSGDDDNPSVEIVFANQGYSNQTAVTSVSVYPATITFSKAGGSTAPTYYSADGGVRLYANNTFTISGATITKVEFTWSSASSNNTNTITSDSGSITDDYTTWTGSSSNLTFTLGATGQRRLMKMVVTYLQGSESGETPVDPTPDSDSFSITSGDVVSGTTFAQHTKTVDGRDWIITFGGNNLSVGSNGTNRSKCVLSGDNEKYAVPVTSSSIASAFANTSSISDISKIEYTYNGGSGDTATNVYLLYSSDNETFTQLNLTSGTQGGAIANEGVSFEFEKCSGYFAVLFVATNTSGNWRIDNVALTFSK